MNDKKPKKWREMKKQLIKETKWWENQMKMNYKCKSIENDNVKIWKMK